MDEFEKRWENVLRETEELRRDFLDAYPNLIRDHHNLLSPRPIDTKSCFDVYIEVGEEYCGWDIQSDTLYIETGAEYHKVWELANNLRILNGPIQLLDNDMLQAIEALPEVEDCAHIYWEARSNYQDESEAFELLSDAIRRSFLVYLGIKGETFVKSASKT